MKKLNEEYLQQRIEELELKWNLYNEDNLVYGGLLFEELKFLKQLLSNCEEDCTKQCSELSQDIAIKFAIFLRDWEYVESHNQWYKGIDFVKSEEELFQIFIEQHYE